MFICKSPLNTLQDSTYTTSNGQIGADKQQRLTTQSQFQQKQQQHQQNKQQEQYPPQQYEEQYQQQQQRDQYQPQQQQRDQREQYQPPSRSASQVFGGEEYSNHYNPSPMHSKANSSRNDPQPPYQAADNRHASDNNSQPQSRRKFHQGSSQVFNDESYQQTYSTSSQNPQTFKKEMKAKAHPQGGQQQQYGAHAAPFGTYDPLTPHGYLFYF